VLAYADIMVKFPQIVPQLPPDLIAVPWFYEPTPDPEYKEWLGPLAAHNTPNIVCSGVHSWNEIAPDYDTTFANIDTLLAACRKVHTQGLINTIWTDDRQVLIRMSWPGIAYGAVAPWQKTPMAQAEFFQAYARLVYPEAFTHEAAQAFTALNAAETSLQAVLGQNTMSAVWSDPFSASVVKRLENHRDELRQCRLHAEEAEEHLYRAFKAGGETRLRDFHVGAQLLDYAGMKFIYALEIQDIWTKLPKAPDKKQLQSAFAMGVTNSTHSRTTDLMDTISQLQQSYRTAWLDQYTDYRLFSVLARWDAEREYWRRAQARLKEFFASFQSGETLPALSDVLSYEPAPSTGISKDK
jgi:hexosaminidase